MEKAKKNINEIVYEAKAFIDQSINGLFLMTTVDYPRDEYVEIICKVKPYLKENMNLVANVGDFDLDYAKILKKAGVNSVYHICRLNEGIDTQISIEDKIATIDAAKAVSYTHLRAHETRHDLV